MNAFIRKLLSYGKLDDQEVALLATASETARLIPARTDLIQEGDAPGPLFVILEGWACRYKLLPDGSRQIMAFLLPGDFCDIHIGALREMDHSIGTITDCRVATVPHKEVEELVTATPALTLAFWRAQLIDEGVLRAWIVNIGRRDSMERVAHLTLELYIRMQEIGVAGSGKCELPLTQTVLADALGLTAVHVNRVVAKLRDRGIMEINSKTLQIFKIGELVRIAGYDDNYLHRRIRYAA